MFSVRGGPRQSGATLLTICRGAGAALQQARMNITLTKLFHFEAAHTLPNVPSDHQCARMHGHSYKVEVSVTWQVG